MARRQLINIAALCFLWTLAVGQIPINPISDYCLGCICEAASNCNRSLNCQGDVCGLFKITRPYWIDANKPTVLLDDVNQPGAFERCVNDPTCAGEAVRNYMTRFAQDCNNDGRIDCRDYAAIHRLGAYGCRGPIEPEYWNNFYQCQQNIANLSPNLDVRGLPLPIERF